MNGEPRPTSCRLTRRQTEQIPTFTLHLLRDCWITHITQTADSLQVKLKCENMGNIAKPSAGCRGHQGGLSAHASTFHNVPQNTHTINNPSSTFRENTLLIPGSIHAKYCSLEGSVHKIYKNNNNKCTHSGLLCFRHCSSSASSSMFFRAEVNRLFGVVAPPPGQE